MIARVGREDIDGRKRTTVVRFYLEKEDERPVAEVTITREGLTGAPIYRCNCGQPVMPFGCVHFARARKEYEENRAVTSIR